MNTRFVTTLCALALGGAAAHSDTVEMMDGTVLTNVFVRSEGVRWQIWDNLEQVGKAPRNVPKSAVRRVTIQRGPEWDVKPDLPDLSVTHIEMNPKLAGLHGRVDYDVYGRPSIGAAPGLVPLDEQTKWTHPERAVANLKLRYRIGERITLTAHVRNLGFATAAPFEYVWLIDGREVQRGRHPGRLAEGQRVTFEHRLPWPGGKPLAEFRIVTDQRQIAVINDTIEDPLWGWSFDFFVNRGRVEAWRQARTAYGTFSFEDFYRWHIDIMNLLFAESRFPATPNGTSARVRLDRIVVLDDVPDVHAEAAKARRADGILYNQGQWMWVDDMDRNRNWTPATHEWRNQTEWSLPHELGHQLGLIDWYNLDYPGDERFTWPDNGERISHFMTFPNQMMHWHGPHLWGEVDAATLERTLGMPRGYYGDFVFAFPDECFIQLLDINGQPLSGVRVDFHQRGADVDPNGTTGEDRGVRWWSVVEDGNFHHRMSERPVMSGTTNAQGLLRLANRPAVPVRTLAGYERRNNPFGNINVVGQRHIMMARVFFADQIEPLFIEAHHFNVEWHRGNTRSATLTLRTMFPSLDSPAQPGSVTVERLEGDKAAVTWTAPTDARERHFQDWVIGYRVYLRKTSDTIATRPWMPVSTVGPNTFRVVVDLKDVPADNWWNSNAMRVGVTSLGFNGRESGLVSTLVR